MMQRQSGARHADLRGAAVVAMMLLSGASHAQSTGAESASPSVQPSAPPVTAPAEATSAATSSSGEGAKVDAPPALVPSPTVIAVFDLDEAPAELTAALAQALERTGTGVVRGAQKTPQQRFGATCGREAACRTNAFAVYPADAGLFGEVWTDETGATPQRALTIVVAQADAVLWEATFLAPNEAALATEADFIAQRALAALQQQQEAVQAEGASVATGDATTGGDAEPALDEDEMEDVVAEEGTRIWPEDAPSGRTDKEPASEADKFASAPAAPVVEQEEGSALLFWGWIGGFVAIGAAMAGSGVLFDLFSPTSANGEIDVGDAVGPALVIAGAAFAVLGVLFNPFSLPEEGAS